MNRLIRIMLSFVLPFFCLLINVSYSLEIEANVTMSDTFPSQKTFDKSTFLNESYTFADVYNISKSYYENSATNETTFNAMKDSVVSAGYNLWFGTGGSSNYFLCYVWQQDYCDVAVRPQDTSDIPFVAWKQGDYTYFYDLYVGCYYRKNETKILQMAQFNNTYPMYIYGLGSIKLFPSSGAKIWDGTSYYYESSLEPDTPSLPSNAEIAQAVQAFYNSDYYKNNKDFSDFIVVYNTTNGYFDFVGHTLGNIFGQVIIPPNYRYQGKMYDEQWWKFFIDENQGALPYGSSYYLYSTNDLGQNITYEGIGKITNLLDVDFGSHSVIVYSTTDYPVRTYVLDETTGDYTYTDGIIEGDQYTYDETLDPTETGYNPLDNFLTVNPSETIIGNADFGDFTNVFEENKDLFSFTENMQWLITANNKLSNYFLGFIVLCALFITLGRVLKG